MRKIVTAFALLIIVVATLWLTGAVSAVRDAGLYRYHQAVTAAAWPYVGITTEFAKEKQAIRSLNKGLDEGTRIQTEKVAGETWWSWSVERRYSYLEKHPRAMLTGRLLLGILIFVALFLVTRFLGGWLVKLITLPAMLYTAYRKQKPSEAHGSARWAEADQVKTLVPTDGEPRFVLGTYRPARRFAKRRSVSLPLEYQNMHVLVIGPSGTMKTNCTVLRNLLAERGDRSVVITDYKGELREKTYGRLNEVFGGRVFIYDPYDPRFGRYNPLDFIHDVTAAQRFAKAIVSNTGESRDEPFWQNINMSMIVGAVMHLGHGGSSVPLATLANFLSRPINEIVAEYEDSPSDVARERARYLLNEVRTNEKLRASVTSELSIRWDWLLEASVRMSSAENTIPLDELSTQPMALFLMLNAEKSETLRPLMSNLWSHIFSNIAANARAEIDESFYRAGGVEVPRGNGQKQTAFYLDEFTNIGVIPHLSAHLTTVRSARASMFFVTQSLSKIDEVYDHGMSETLYGACATKIVLGGTSGRDATFISKDLGDTTLVTSSSNRSRRTSELVRGQAGQTLTETRRALLEAVEVREKLDKLVAIVAGKRPMLLDKDPYFAHGELVAATKRKYALDNLRDPRLPQDPGLKWTPPTVQSWGERSPGESETSTEERILTLHRQGHNIAEITRILHVSSILVRRAIADGRHVRRSEIEDMADEPTGILYEAQIAPSGEIDKTPIYGSHDHE